MPAEKNNSYAMCDFCHKTHKKAEIEKVTITYHKCTGCEVEVTLGHAVDVRPMAVQVVPPMDQTQDIQPFINGAPNPVLVANRQPVNVKPRPKVPPPTVAAAFAPPPSSQALT